MDDLYYSINAVRTPLSLSKDHWSGSVGCFGLYASLLYDDPNQIYVMIIL